jgi:hypothetical protein
MFQNPFLRPGHRKLVLMDATFAFLSCLKLPAHGYAKIPFSVVECDASDRESSGEKRFETRRSV